MKTAILSLFSLSCFSQTNQTFPQKQKSDSANFISTIYIENATKDGIYVNGYVVNINYEKVKSLNGKKVRISGKVTLVKGIRNNILEQGRTKDTKHIENPIIQVLDK